MIAPSSGFTLLSTFSDISDQTLPCYIDVSSASPPFVSAADGFGSGLFACHVCRLAMVTP